MNTPALNGFLQNHQNGCDFYSKEPCSCGLEMARYELAQLKIALAVQTSAVEYAKWKERLNILREIYAESLKYGASYFLGKPMERFSSWLQIQLLETERTYNTWLTKYGKE